MEADVRWCTHCQQRGEKRRLRLPQINESLAVLLCENEKCVRIGKTSSISSVILQRKASDIPNTKKKKNKQLPAGKPTSKIPDSSPPNGSVQFSNSDKTDDSPEKVARSTSVNSERGTSDASADLRAGVFSSTAMPQVALWANKSALCWLDACLCVLTACRSLRACLAHLPAKSAVRSLCLAFVKAQRTQVTKQNKTRDSSPACSLVLKTTVLPPVANTFPEDTDVAVTARSEQDSVNLNWNADACEIKGKTGRLDGVRDELYRRLQPMMKLGEGKEDSPVVALPSLLRLDGSIEEHFMCRYRWEFCCSVCGHTQLNWNKKTMLSFPSVPADFSMTDPVMLHNCYKCGSQNQNSRIVFHSLSACVMMHFQEGFPDGDLSNHLAFHFSGDTYTLAAVVRYRRNPNHFVTAVRDPETNHWLEYDDLMPSPYTWQPHPPRIPAREIHILVWERLKTPCTACVQLHSDLASVLNSPVKTPPSGIPVGAAVAAPQKGTSSQWNGNGTWKKSRFSLNSAFRAKPEQRQDAENRSSSGRTHIGPAEVEQEETLNGVDVERSTNTNVVEIDLTSEMESDSHGRDVCLSRRESATNVDPKGLSKVSFKETPKLPRVNLNGTEKPQSNASHCATTVNRTESSQDSKNKVGAQKRNVVVQLKQGLYVPEPTFLGNLTSRSKCVKDNDSTTSTSAILAKIPDQLLRFSRQSNASSSRPRIESTPSSRDSTSRNASILNKIPKQLLLESGNPRATPCQQFQSEASSRLTRPILVGSSRRAPVKQVKFQPYGQSPKQNYQENKNLPVKRDNRGSASTLSSWQKRVGMYSSAVDIPRKRVRHDSVEDNSSTYSDLPKHAGPPCSSVSSPSACSDISSLSDNQSFASGKDDLTNTIDELCKVLDVGSNYTPSASSRFSSPSQDMFFSELFADESISGTLDNTFHNERISDANTGRLHTPLTSFDNYKSVTMTSASTSTPDTHLHSSTREHYPNCVVAPFVGSSRPAVTALNASPPIANDKRQDAAHISSHNRVERTLPSVDTECPALTQSQSAMLPSCDPIDPVAGQQDSGKPVRHVDNKAVAYVTSRSDDVIAASGFGSLSDATSGASYEAARAMDDITDTGLFDTIQDNLDVLGTEWNDNLFELLAQ